MRRKFDRAGFRTKRMGLARTTCRTGSKPFETDKGANLKSNIQRKMSSRSISPRGLSRVEAANYVGISPSLFDGMVRDGRMPPPKRINSRTVWDIRQLDDAFEALPSDDNENRDPFESVTL